MTVYRNVKVNLVAPRSQLDRCAATMLGILQARPGQHVYSWEFDTPILNAKSKLHLKCTAAKALRNMGYSIAAHKARHESYYVLMGTPDTHERHRRHFVREAYSAQVTFCRSMSQIIGLSPTDPILSATLQHGTLTALSLGVDAAVGKTIPQIMSDLQPI
jgi:hypothetical protein